MRTIRAIVPRGFTRMTDAQVTVELVEPKAGIGQIRCIECLGRGWIEQPDPQEPEPTMQCIECKGSGYVYVTI